MKTIGEIISLSRQDQRFTHQQLSDLTKIDVRYIIALEKNDFRNLPSITFTKGFVRNLAISLNKNPDEWVAILRRDYQLIKANETTVAPVRHTHKLSLNSLFQSRAVTLISAIIIFLVYLTFQYRAVISSPPLEISKPIKEAVLVSPVSVEGKTSPGATISLNDDLKITPDSSGNFNAKINLPLGQNEIKVSVINRFSRSTTKIIPVTIVSQ